MRTSLLAIFRSGRVVGDALRRYRALAIIGGVSIATVDLLDVVLPLVLKSIIDAIEHSDRETLLTCCLLYVAIAVVQAIGRILWRVGFIQVGTRTGRDLRYRMLSHLMRLPLAKARKYPAGQIVSSAQSDVESVRMALETGMITLFDGSVYLLTIPLIMFWLSPGLTVLSLMMLPAIPLLVLQYEKRLKDAARAQQDTVAELTENAHESLSAIRLIKSFAAEERFAARFAAHSEKVARASIELARREALFSPRLEAVISISMTMLLFIGGDLVLSEQLSIGTYVAFQRYLQNLLWPTQAIGVWFSQLQRAAASSERVEAILERDDSEGASVIPGDVSPGAPALEIRNLSFSYPGTNAPLLDKISFSLARGERIAIVGGSGAGKTTLIELLTGIRPLPQESGSILIGGKDASSAGIEWIREHLALVEQNPFLFSDTVHANIRPGASADRIQAAARTASVADEIKALPQGFESLIGERGVTLSGGQRQRLAIARSLMRNASVLVWDNALSSVDLVTEARILEALRELPKDTAMIVVTHRLSTTLHMDRILVLNQGRIEQAGSHEQLAGDRNGWYFGFCEHQKRVSQLEALEEREVRE